jgi:hypothetical protein
MLNTFEPFLRVAVRGSPFAVTGVYRHLPGRSPLYEIHYSRCPDFW